jgi:hypothetical protein
MTAHRHQNRLLVTRIPLFLCFHSLNPGSLASLSSGSPAVYLTCLMLQKSTAA